MTNQVQIVIEIIEGTIIIYFGITLGFLWMRTRLAQYRKEFVNFTINLITPTLIFFSILRLDQTSLWFIPVVGVLALTYIGITFPKIMAKLTHQEEPDPAEICTATFPNALNFPFPIIFALSPNALGAASIFLATTIIMRNTIGLKISGVNLSKENLKSILTFPPIIGIILGFSYRILRLDTEVAHTTPVRWFFQFGIIMTLMTVGFGLTRPKFEYKNPIIRVFLTRFIFSGSIAILLVLLFPIDTDMSIALLVQMIAPPAVYNGLYAEKFGLNTELTSQVIISVTLIALIFLPFELILIKLLFLQ